MPPKTVYFSSVYSFSPDAVDELRDGSSKFIRYDRGKHNFAMKTDNDEETERFTTKLRRYIDNQPKEDGFDPKLIPLPNTHLTSPLQLLKAKYYSRKTRHQYGEDSGEEAEAKPVTSYRVHWQPECGILPSIRDIEPLYAGLNCVIDTERQQRRLDICALEIRGLDARVVLKRLENTEKLWELLREPLKKNNLALENRRDNHRFEICALRGNQQEPHDSIRRILLDDANDATSLLSKYITQLRVAARGEVEIPPNLQKQDKIYKDRTRVESSQWNNVIHERYGKGNVSSLTPFTESSSNTASVADQQSRVEISREQSRYLTIDKSLRVNEWAGNVEVGAEPTIEVEAPPKDGAARKFGKSRRVKVSEEESVTTGTEGSDAAPDCLKSGRSLSENIEGPSNGEAQSDMVASGPTLHAPSHLNSVPAKRFGKTRRVKVEEDVSAPPVPSPPQIDPYAGLALWDQPRSPEKMQSNDEVTNRKFHSVMGQKAGKPKNKGEKGVSNAAKKRKEVLEASWGKPPENSQGIRPVPETSPRDETFALRYATDFFPCLNSANAFFGKLELKVDIGQILITGYNANGATASSSKSTVYDIQDWDNVMRPANNRTALRTGFTNLLTANGRDIDHILSLRYHNTVPSTDDPFAGKLDLFNIEPKERATRYEFHCHSKDNQPFILTFSTNGECTVTKPSVELCTVHMHYLAQIWDARMRLSGCQTFYPSIALEEAIRELKDSVYCPGGKMEADVQYVRPASNEIMIDKVLCKRFTKHTCKKNPGILIVPTQVQRLNLQSKSGNSALCRAYSTPYAQMADAGALHWTVSLESEYIIERLRENETMVPGNLPTRWTPQGIVFANNDRDRPSEHLVSLLDTTNLVMKQIDGVGALNFGTLLRVLEASGSAMGGTAYGLGGSSLQRGGEGWPVQPHDSASQAGGRTLVTHGPTGGKKEVSANLFW